MRWQTEPEAVVEEAVCTADPSCLSLGVAALVEKVFRQRPQRRELARVLGAEPDLLTSGSPQGPRAVERLIRALIDAGAGGVVLPSCAGCGKQRPLTAVSPHGRTCTSCYNRTKVEKNRCVECGRADFAGRDREGRPRCRRHRPDPDVDPVAEIAGLLTGTTGLGHGDLEEVVRRVERTRAGQLRLWWALAERPELLTGAGAEGPKAVSTLAAALVARGAAGVVVPVCPWCRTTTDLRSQREGKRCCTRCWNATRLSMCTRCGRERPHGGYDGEGHPVCAPCRQRDPLHHQRCDGCGELRLRKVRTAGGGLCPSCRTNPYALCATCGAWRPCWFAATPTPRCQPCTAKARTQDVCVRCAQYRRVNNRTAAGEPICSGCGHTPRPCAGCGKNYRSAGRTEVGRSLCQTCWGKDPRAKKPCTRCRTVARLYHRGLCAGCARERSLREVLRGPGGGIRPELEPVLATLLDLDAHTVLRWIRKTPARRDAFRKLAAGTGPVTHEALDAVADGTVADHLRALLVAGGALPDRDEHLARLEAWLPKVLARIPDPGERRIVERWARWQPLRRLRRQPAHRPTTRGQADGIRHEVRAIVRLLEWLPGQETGLASCTQDHIDVYLTTGAPGCQLVRSFLHWTSRHGHTRSLTAPLYTSSFAADILAADARWKLVHRLVQDPAIAVCDRAAGLLLLLFAQPPARIARLSHDDILDDGTTLRLRLGAHPVEIPAPLDGMIRELIDHPTGKAPVLDRGPSRWLFPGALADRPMEPASLSKRLKALGIRPRATRNASLMDLAAELPAYVFSRLLGFCPQTAANWSAETSAADAGYAAQRARRRGRAT
ncbi:hypothetical protein OG304_37015 [Streptomyces sp. NBC_00160]|uniref:hypothetical protein n=1 Tax=Streptomyces TaxID=1883 RepID=UPI0022587054|nr:hypothetical protein [Streptomyces sp. NBC_00160]MCX5308986.1 hypothetical protein [Streptomyces sp. NBC_00160]